MENNLSNEEIKKILEENKRLKEQLNIKEEDKKEEKEEEKIVEVKEVKEEKTKEKKKDNKTTKKEVKKKNNKTTVFLVLIIVFVLACLIVINIVLPSVYYNRANESYNAKNYKTAIDEFSKVDSDYKDVKEKVSNSYFEYGKEELAKKNYDKAYELFEKSNNEEAFNYASYASGMIDFNNEDYGESIKIFSDLNDFLDSHDYLVKSYYLKAESLFKKEKYGEAITYYNEVIDYEDSKSKIDECNYQIAEDYLAKKNYTKASEYYKLVKNYKDTKEKLDICTYATTFEQAEKYYKEGSLYNAEKTYKKIPDSFKMNGVKVSTRKKTLKKYKDFVQLSRKWAGKGKYEVKDIHDSTGYWNSWYNNQKDTLEFKCIINDDGSVSVKGEASFEIYTNYSSLSSLLDIDYESISISFKVKKGGKIPKYLVKNRKCGDSESGKQGKVNITYHGSTIKLSYYNYDRNASAYFSQKYTSNMTYKKK